MDKTVVFEKIRSILAEIADLSPEEITSERALMDDLDLSSMEIMTLIAGLEDEFDLRIPERELRNFVTVSDLVDYLAAQGA